MSWGKWVEEGEVEVRNNTLVLPRREPPEPKKPWHEWKEWKQLQDLCSQATAMDRVTQENQPFNLEGWLEEVEQNGGRKKTPFGTKMSWQEMENMISKLPEVPPTPPIMTPDSKWEESLDASPDTSPVFTPLGWRFHAPEQLRKHLHNWEGAPQRAIETIREGWKGAHVKNIAPIWFRQYKLPEEAEIAWEKEIDTMWMAGVIEPLSKEWVRKHGLPDVVLPCFLVDEGSKWRLIVDARYSNLGQQPRSFKLPGIGNLVSMLTEDSWWATSDMKTRWWHIPYHIPVKTVCH